MIWSSSGNKYNNGTAISAAPVSNLHETPYLLFTVSIKQSLPEGPESLHGLVGLTLPWAFNPSSANHHQDATTQAIGMDDSFPKPSDIGAFQKVLASKESWFLVENIWASDCKINRFAKKKVPEASLPPIEKFAEHDVARRLLVEDISNSAGFPSNGFPLNACILVGGVWLYKWRYTYQQPRSWFSYYLCRFLTSCPVCIPTIPTFKDLYMNHVWIVIISFIARLVYLVVVEIELLKIVNLLSYNYKLYTQPQKKLKSSGRIYRKLLKVDLACCVHAVTKEPFVDN